MSRNYKFHNTSGLYFVSFATVYWLDVFTSHIYFDVLTESINYCRAKEGMELYSYCFMPNHLHLIFRSNNDEPYGVLRDFKSFTAKNLIKAIETNPLNCRKEYLLWFFERAAKKKNNSSKYQFWQHHNNPE